MNIILLLPNQLFEQNKLIAKNSLVYLIEHPTYFTLYKYHKLKLIFHRSTMKYYSDYIKTKYKCNVKYINFNNDIVK